MLLLPAFVEAWGRILSSVASGAPRPVIKPVERGSRWLVLKEAKGLK
jgi:hypothetical protein